MFYCWTEIEGRPYLLSLGYSFTVDSGELLFFSLKTAVGIFQIVNNRGVVTQLFLVKLETYIESHQRISLNEC